LVFGGLVGPILLIVYFVFETQFDRQSTQWMLWAGMEFDALRAAAVPGR
jgi:hypothetical protein